MSKVILTLENLTAANTKALNAISRAITATREPRIATDAEVRRLRRLAAKNGMTLHRKVNEYGYDGYMLCDAYGGYVIAGSRPMYSLSYDDALWWITTLGCEEAAEG